MRSTLRSGALALTALFAVAACSGAGASPAATAPSAAHLDGPQRGPGQPGGQPVAERRRLRQGRSHAGGTRQVHDRDRQPSLPALLQGEPGRATRAVGQVGRPDDRQGFESAVGFAIADKLGFAKDEVAWVDVPFANSYAPGPKTFDIDLNQVAYTAARAETADLSDGYYFGPQTVVVPKSSPLAKATSIAELKDAKFGAQTGTTSYDAIVNVIKPTNEPMAYDSNDAAIQALKVKQIDALVVDLPTSDFITNVQLDTSTAIGIARPGRSRALQRGPGQGQPADRLRQPGDQGADRRRDAQDADRQVAPVRERAGAQAMSRRLTDRTARRDGRSVRRPGRLRRPDGSPGRARAAARSSSPEHASGQPDRRDQHDRVLHRARPDRRQRAGLAARSRRRSSTARSSPTRGRSSSGRSGSTSAVRDRRAARSCRSACSSPSCAACPAGLPAAPDPGHVYADVFRALPGVLVIFMLGFGIPGLGLAGVPVDPFFYASSPSP